MQSLCQLLLAASTATFALAQSPSFAEEVGTMAAEPMKTDQTSTGTMSTGAMSAGPMTADPIKADCIAKAGAETDAAKKEMMMAECNAMGGSMMMKAAPMAPKQ
jgi:hypothetical protein